MDTKQQGICPFCLKNVKPLIIEKNLIRRDQCECPECKEKIYLCRTPGCHDFAKGTSVYDHELCPSCTKTASNAVAVVGDALLKIGGPILIAVATKKSDKGNNKGK
jgi:hypothetical protein